jgi:hypothetical protein
MSRTYEQIRQLTAQQTGLFWTTGTVDDSGSAAGILRAAALTRYQDDRLIGNHLLLTSGSPNYTELLIFDSFQTDGDLRFRPGLSSAPHGLTFEILPFSGTDFLHATKDAILHLYDVGLLQRTFWTRMVGGSPIYNADFSYWSSSSVVDGWTATSTILSQERASGNLAIPETSLALTTTAGYVSLDAQYRRYLNDLKDGTITFHCWVLTSAGSNARINLYNGSDNYSTYHGGGGDWELLSVEVDTAYTDTDITPRLYIDTTTTAYFSLPFVTGGGISVRTYPMPIGIMPDGPLTITETALGYDVNRVADGRGTADIRQLGRQHRLVGYDFIKHHDMNATGQVGVLDFSLSTRPPSDSRLLWLRGDGPLTVPTSALSTDNIEVTESESLLLASVVAVKLLERASAGTPLSTRRLYKDRIDELNGQIGSLSEGAGESRDSATYSIGW